MSRQGHAGILGLILLALVFWTSCNSSNFNTPDRSDRSYERIAAKRGAQHGICSAAGGDSDDGRIAGERRVRGLHGSGDGSKRHIRNGCERTQKRIRPTRAAWPPRQPSPPMGRSEPTTVTATCCRSDGHGHLQSDEYLGACGIDHGDEWIPARCNNQHRV